MAQNPTGVYFSNITIAVGRQRIEAISALGVGMMEFASSIAP